MSKLNISLKDQISYERANEDEPYELKGDSLIKTDVEKGTLLECCLIDSKIYPGVCHKYKIYIPANYDDSIPASLILFLDGHSYIKHANAPIVLDNLISKGDIPPTIAIFLEPGDKGPGLPIYGGNDNRSFEYDKVDQQFVSFLERELLSLIEKEYLITTDAKKRIICGFSSGGIAAFNAAWNRPDLFGNVISHSGSFIAIRGGEMFPTLIRKENKKPLKIWMSAGKKDLDIVFGDLKQANEYMASSLEYMGYEYQFHLTEGGHNLKYGSSMLPETLRWIFN